MKSFRLYYFFSGAIRSFDIDHPEHFTTGFWLNRYFRLPENSEDKAYWIPPHKIEKIEKIIK